MTPAEMIVELHKQRRALVEDFTAKTAALDDSLIQLHGPLLNTLRSRDIELVIAKGEARAVEALLRKDTPENLNKIRLAPPTYPAPKLSWGRRIFG
jgi:hypothetical protein